MKLDLEKLLNNEVDLVSSNGLSKYIKPLVDIEKRFFMKSELGDKIRLSKFDISDYLGSNEMIAEYLNTVLQDGDDAEMLIALGNVAKAIGMTKIAEKTGMSRPSLYKALSEGAKPQFSTIMKVLKAVGGQVHINPLTS